MNKATILLWLMVWGGLNTGISNVLAPTFLENPFSFINGLRAFAPLVAAWLAIIIWLMKGENSIFSFALGGPLALLTLYGLAGMFSLLFSPAPLTAFYWNAVYLAVLFVTWVCSRHIHLSICTNGVIAILLTFYFMLGPLRSQLVAIIRMGQPTISAFRVDSGLIGVGSETANGIGRFAAVSSIVALCRLNQNMLNRRFLWILVLLPCLVVLAISQSRTAIIASILAYLLVIWLNPKQWWHLVFGTATMLLIYVVLIQWRPTALNFDFGHMTGGRWVTAWQPGLDLLGGSPLLGFGFDADRLLVFSHMHNSLLHAAIQTGIIGAGFFVGAFVWTWILVLRVLLRRNLYTSEISLPYLVEACAIVAFFTFRGLFESTAAFYGVDLIMLAPVMAFLHTQSRQIATVTKQGQSELSPSALQAVETVKQVNDNTENKKVK